MGPMTTPRPPKPEVTAVLLSGGIDSAVLAADLLREGRTVHPLFVRCGHRWEATELHRLRRFLDAIRSPRLLPLVVLESPVDDLLVDHWSVSGSGVPDGDSPDEAVFLPARNVLLLGKAMLWCHLHGVGELALGILGGNPFPDASPSFFDAFAGAVNLGLGGSVRILRPFAELGKAGVLRRGRGLPLELTFSCLQPADGLHCGDCNKCTERRRAFDEAGVADLTEYAAPRAYVAGVESFGTRAPAARLGPRQVWAGSATGRERTSSTDGPAVPGVRKK
jgi:7-cyano-7-deazaguanine synthase